MDIKPDGRNTSRKKPWKVIKLISKFIVIRLIGSWKAQVHWKNIEDLRFTFSINGNLMKKETENSQIEMIFSSV